MRPALDDSPILHNENQIGFEYGGKPVSNHDGSPVAQSNLEGSLNGRLRFGIEMRGRFVKNHNIGSFQKKTRDRQALLLAPGETISSLAD